MTNQRGISLSGLILVLFVLMMGALLGFKLFEPYSQYFAIQKTFKVLAQNPNLKGGNRREVLNAFQNYAMIDNLTAIKDDDIEIAREGGGIVISAAYSVKVPLFKNISLLIDFAPTSLAR